MERMMKDSHSHSLVQAITATRHDDVMHLVMSVFVLLDCDYFSCGGSEGVEMRRSLRGWFRPGTRKLTGQGSAPSDRLSQMTLFPHCDPLPPAPTPKPRFRHIIGADVPKQQPVDQGVRFNCQH